MIFPVSPSKKLTFEHLWKEYNCNLLRPTFLSCRCITSFAKSTVWSRLCCDSARRTAALLDGGFVLGGRLVCKLATAVSTSLSNFPVHALKKQRLTAK